MLTIGEILDALLEAARRLKAIDGWFGVRNGTFSPVTLRGTDQHGNRLRLVCGIEFVKGCGDDEEGGDGA